MSGFGVLMAVAAAIGAILPWAMLFALVRAGVRRFRPRRLERPRGVPLARPGNPAAGALIVLIAVGLLVAWAWYTQPLWGRYAAEAWDYRVHAGGPANAISSQLMSTDLPLATARIHYGYISYSVGPATEPARAWITFHWRGVPTPPAADAPVAMTTAPGPAGTYALTYRKDLGEAALQPIRQAFDRIAGAQAPVVRRAAVDVPLLLRSVKGYWQDYFGYADHPAGIAKLAAGLPATVPMSIYGLLVGMLPAR